MTTHVHSFARLAVPALSLVGALTLFACKPGATSPAATAPTSATSSCASCSGGVVRYLGRVDASDPKAPRFAWTMSGLTAIVNGTTIGAKLRTDGTEKVFLQPLIDGKVSGRIEVASGADREIMLGTGLAPGDHVVELYRETEGAYGSTVFLGFTSGTLKGHPPRRVASSRSSATRSALAMASSARRPTSAGAPARTAVTTRPTRRQRFNRSERSPRARLAPRSASWPSRASASFATTAVRRARF